ncbi:MAG TPA: hypothetical protein VNA57_00010 [Acidimicrobiales bacterium]|nr:hypothetical protein [Acidimicrobiales bacterium]
MDLLLWTFGGAMCLILASFALTRIEDTSIRLVLGLLLVPVVLLSFLFVLKQKFNDQLGGQHDDDSPAKRKTPYSAASNAVLGIISFGVVAVVLNAAWTLLTRRDDSVSVSLALIMLVLAPDLWTELQIRWHRRAE